MASNINNADEEDSEMYEEAGSDRNKDNQDDDSDQNSKSDEEETEGLDQEFIPELFKSVNSLKINAKSLVLLVTIKSSKEIPLIDECVLKKTASDHLLQLGFNIPKSILLKRLVPSSCTKNNIYSGEIHMNVVLLLCQL